MAGQWIAIDFDHTIWDNAKQEPMDGVRDALDEFHSRGLKIMVHSANRPEFISKMCEEHNLHVDGIWPHEKPVAAVYLDDRGLHFTTWAEAIPRVLEMVAERPVRR